MHLLTTVAAGFLLGIGGPKRLVLTGLASTTIVTAGRDAGEAVLVVVYVAVATALVWGPVILDVLLGEHAVALMQGAPAGVSVGSRK